MAELSSNGSNELMHYLYMLQRVLLVTLTRVGMMESVRRKNVNLHVLVRVIFLERNASVSYILYNTLLHVPLSTEI